jgi:hypothetical protein
MKTKSIIILALVLLAIILTGFGGLQDMFGFSFFGMTKEHAWHDATFFLMIATLITFTNFARL